MSAVHERIEDKLLRYSESIRRLAIEALKYSSTMPETSVTEHLKNSVRVIAKEMRAQQ